MDVEWALTELRTFVELTTLVTPPPTPGVVFFGDDRYPKGRGEIPAAAQVIEQVLDRVLPDWRSTIPERWQQHREAANRAIAQLEREEELRERLGNNAPVLNAARLHPWVWESARSLWQSRHFREAVRAASVKLNAETQNKRGGRDLSETALFQMAFSADEPTPTRPRRRSPSDDGRKTALSIRRGIMAFAEGCFAAIRNPTSHDVQDEVPEHEALEQLATFSVLARWVDRATISR